ncbi:hypothetical protein BC833DRAFT_595619 [Globomyces pollinis-pini]|nr:hypothetical protein BC833DRAFT_595619 [Globomyces pollinis-pini]
MRRLQGLELENTKPIADLESTVQERVDYELQKQKQVRLIHEKNSSLQVEREAQELLIRQQAIPVLKINPVFQELQDKVVRCYRNNPTRVLDCWREVEEFKKAEKLALKDFVYA